MEKIEELLPGIQSVESNPRAKAAIGTVLDKVAGLHAAFWDDEVLRKEACNLSPFPGMGAFLTGEEKEDMFPDACKAFLDYVERRGNEAFIMGGFKQEEQQKFHQICRDFSSRHLREIHAYVHERTQLALIHGDLHFGNMLFRKCSDDSKEGQQNDQEIYLIDWATCGRGNPMRDIAFFRILCMDVDETEVVGTHLQQYYSTLCESYTKQRRYTKNEDNQGIENTFTWKACIEAYDMCILNQFLILICYHELTETFINQEGLGEKEQISRSRHFQGVYRRCIQALLQSYSRVESRSQLPTRKENSVPY